MTLFIARMAYPSLTYLFIPAFILSIILYYDVLVKLRFRQLKDIFVSTWEFNVIGVLVIIALTFSSKFYITPIKESFTYIIIMILVSLELQRSTSVIPISIKSLNYIIYLSGIIALIGLLHLINVLNIYENIGSSIVSDNNFYALFSILGIIGIIYKTRTEYNKDNKLLNFFLVLLFLNILFSLSRRGVILIALFIIFFFIDILHALIFKYESKLKKLRAGICIFLGIVTILLILLFTPYKIKSRISHTFGIQYHEIEKLTTNLLYEYSTVFSKNITYEDIKTSFVLSKFDPADPNTWATRKHRIIKNIYGENKEIVPEGANGYLLNSETEASTWDNNAYSYTLIGKDSVNKNNIIDASVFCYVSPDFNGTWVRLSSDGSVIGEKATYYDLEKKGTWQKLSLVTKCQDGVAYTFLYFSKFGDTDFSNLEGHVIFAYPEYSTRKIDPKDPYTWGTRKYKLVTNLPGTNSSIVPEQTKGYLLDKNTDANTWSNNAYSYTRIGNDEVDNGDTLIAFVYCYVSPDFNGTWVRLSSDGADFGKITSYYDLSRKGKWQKLSIIAKCKKGRAPVFLYFSKFGDTDFSNLKGYVIFAHPQYQIIDHESPLSSFSKDNITLGTYKSDNNNLLSKKTINNLNQWQSNKLSGQRITRWIYAWNIFKNDFEVIEKIFGGGFDYITKFNHRFFPEKTKDDYPHNPIIASFLYSGLVGGLFYIYFIVASITIYWRYRNKLSEFLIMYIICFFFTFFSGNTHFSVPIFALLSLIPFLTRFPKKVSN